MKYEIQVIDMKVGLAHLQQVNGKVKTLAVIYAEGTSVERMNATIDLCAAAFDLLNERLHEIRREHDKVLDSGISNLAWYYEELAKGNGDRLTLRPTD